MIPTWLHVTALMSLAIAALSALGIAIDEARYPQKMWIMALVWPLTALYAGPLAVWAYLRFGRVGGSGRASRAVAVGKAAAHCGSGCTLGDLAAEWLAFLVPSVAVWFGWQSLFADKIFAVWLLDFLFAFGLGVMFQYFTIAPMRGLGLGAGLVAALKADALSLIAWQVGMYGFMGLAHFWLFPRVIGAALEMPGAEFWLMMQIAMLAGFATAYPVNWVLIRTGIKEEM